MVGRDYYGILGIKKGASLDDIKKRFRQLALLHHPDRNPEDPIAEEMFKLVAEAYHVLSNHKRRRLYDHKGSEGLKENGYRADQVQAFLPSPMALASTMWHTGRNPLKKVTRHSETVYSPKGARQRRLHKAFLRYHDPKNWPLLREALTSIGRTDLIGNGKRHLVPAWQPGKEKVTTGVAKGGGNKRLTKTKKAGTPSLKQHQKKRRSNAAKRS